ncbi:MAG: glycosyltransferase family 2 protein [Dehalococcoidia bacterium]|nr:glycosyltransferase family 2 protein [Dehalococcoidia bacterium]
MTQLASVIVLSYNGREYLGPCLSSLESSSYREIEVLLVDNGSTDGSAQWVAATFPKVSVVAYGENLGFAGGMNRGIRTAQGRFIGFLNQDTTVRPAWLENLVTALKDPAVGMAGSKIYYPDGLTLQHAGGIIRYPQALADHFGYGQLDQGQWDQEKDVDYVTGAAFATRRDVLESIGVFDEGFYPAYFEDTDLCFRARDAGYRVVYIPEAVLVHHESATTVRDSFGYYLAYHTARLRFILKHYSVLQITEDFYPAERAWLEGGQSADERRALGLAYQAARAAKGGLPSLTPVTSRLLGRLADEAAGAQETTTNEAPPGVLGRLKALLNR